MTVLATPNFWRRFEYCDDGTITLNREKTRKVVASIIEEELTKD